MSPTELINKFNLKCTFLQAYGIICAIPSSWKSKIREFGKRLLVVKPENIEILFKTKKVTSFTYDSLRKSVATQPTRVQRKWDKLLPSPVEDWSNYYSIPFLCTSASKLRSFQYRIFHRTIGANVLLMKMESRITMIAFFVTVNPADAIEHLFWFCDRIFPLWNALAHWIRSVTEIEIEFSLESVLLGYTNCMPCKNAINCIILASGQVFHTSKCKMEGRNPDFAGIQSYLKFNYSIEKFACDFALQDKFLCKWKQMKKLFCQ